MIQEHRAILEAIQGRDAEKAERQMKLHLKNSLLS
jgi:DNA-binding FadR family transcriptional regulator